MVMKLTLKKLYDADIIILVHKNGTWEWNSRVKTAEEVGEVLFNVGSQIGGFSDSIEAPKEVSTYHVWKRQSGWNIRTDDGRSWAMLNRVEQVVEWASATGKPVIWHNEEYKP